VLLPLAAWLPGFVLKGGLPGAQEAVTRFVVKGHLTWVQEWPRLPDLFLRYKQDIGLSSGKCNSRITTVITLRLHTE
jgi:hypothetical protein